jgi:hypothetical protein
VIPLSAVMLALCGTLAAFMSSKLDLPDGAKVGSILEITWSGSEASIEPGTYEGRLIGIKGQRITVRCYYEGDEPETVVINLETGIDETCHARVSNVRLRPTTKRAAKV